MKQIGKQIKNNIMGFLIGGILFSCISISAAGYLYNANEVSYIPTDTSWNVTDVEGALNALFSESKTSVNFTGMELITQSSFKSNITTTARTDSISIDVGDYNKLLVVIHMGNYWNSTDSTTITFTGITSNNSNLFFLSDSVGVGGSDAYNGRLAYAIGVVECTPNTTNSIEITTKSKGTSFSIAKYYKIYGIN